MSNLGRAIRNNISQRRVEQKIKNSDINSRNRNIDSFRPPNFRGKKSESLASKCEIGTVDDFLVNVSRSRKNFVLRSRQDDIVLVENGLDDLALKKDLSRSGLSNLKKMANLNKSELLEDIKVIRRPRWDSATDPNELAFSEENAFIDWKKDLSLRFTESKLVLTPFEKNLDIWRQLWRVVEKSNLLVQIVDARNPILFWSKDLFQYANENANEYKIENEPNLIKTKKTLLLLNKADLLSEIQRKKWRDYLIKENVDFAFFSATKNVEEEKNGEEEKILLCSDKILSPKSLRDYFETEAISFSESIKSKFSQSRFVVGMTGYPNVGKSSVINILFGSKKVSVGVTPGKTKHFQTLNISENLQLCDCPGLVFPSLSNSRAELICSGIISVEHSKNLFESVELITRRVPTHYFLKVYKGLTLPVNEEFVSCQRVLSTLSTQKGWLTACSQPNLSKSARQIIKDYLSGDLLFCFAPPDLGEEELQDFYRIEKKGLKEELGMRKETPLLLEKEKVFDERLGGSKKKHFRRTREFRRKERKEMNSQKRSVKILT